MPLLDMLKTIPTFPQVSTEALRALERSNVKTRERLRRIPTKNAADKALLQEIQAISELCIYVEANQTYHIYELLPHLDLETLDTNTVLEVSQYWEQQLQEALQAEPHPLLLLPLLEEHYSTPIQLSVLIRYLLDHDTRADAIIQSRVLHRFCVKNASNQAAVSDVYALLYQAAKTNPELPLLLEQMDNRYLAPRVIDNVWNALSGRALQEREAENFISLNDFTDASLTPKSALSFTKTHDNWRALTAAFGESFLLRAVQENATLDVKEWLSETLHAMPEDALASLFKTIQTSVAEEQRNPLLTYLGQLVTQEQALRLVHTKQVSCWLMFAAKPDLLDALTEIELKDLITQSPIIPSEIVHIITYINQPKLTPYSEIIHSNILECLLEHAQVAVDPGVLEYLQTDARTQTWCAAHHQKLLTQFKQDIHDAMPLTAHTYITMMDSYHEKCTSWQLLKDLGFKHILEDNYAAQSYIMLELFQTESQVSFECLDIFHPAAHYTSYGPEARQSAKIRTLLVSLVEQPDAAFQALIAQALKTQFNQDWKECSVADVTLLELAIQKENTSLLKLYFSSMSVAQIFDAVHEKNSAGDTLLHRAAFYPESLKIILELYPEDARLDAVKVQDKYGNALLHRAAYNTESLKIILELLPENVRLDALMVKNDFGDTLLHWAVETPESLKIILALLPENDRLEAVKVEDKYGVTLLHLAAFSPELLKIILALLPENARLDAVKVEDSDGDTLLHRAVGNPQSLKITLELLPENARLDAVKVTDRDGHTPLHRAAYNTESLKIILELLPENVRLDAVKVEDKYGVTLLHLAAFSPESLKITLELLPENARLDAVKVEDSDGNTLLHLAAFSPESLKIILALLPENARLDAVKVQDKYGNTPLHLAAYKPESLKIILELYPENVRLDVVKVTDSAGNTLLHRAVDNPESLKIILALLPENARLDALKVTDSDGNTLLHLAAFSPESLKIILALLPENARLDVVKVTNSDGDTLLHLAAFSPESLKIILALLPENDRLDAIKVEDKYGDTLLHLAADNPESLKIILELYPENARLDAIKVQDKYGNTLLYRAAGNPESLKIILALYPENAQLDAIKVQDKYGSTLLHQAVFSPESLKIILALYPEDARLDAVKVEDKYGVTLLHLAAFSPESLKIILALLPENARLDAVIDTFETMSNVDSKQAFLQALPQELAKALTEHIARVTQQDFKTELNKQLEEKCEAGVQSAPGRPGR